MKKLLLFLPLLALVWACTPTGEGGASSSSAELKTLIDSASYAQGIMMGKQVKSMQADGESLLNSASLKAGLDEGLAGGEGVIPEKELQDVMMKFQMQLQQASQKKAQVESVENKAKGAAYLAENAAKEGVVTTASGLQYKVLREGTGATPTSADKVEVNYEGRLIDGKVFDSSYERGKPISFAVTGVIPGWTEALQLMKEGAKYQLYIPSELAYGERGSAPDIGAGATLVFDVELLKVNP